MKALLSRLCRNEILTTAEAKELMLQLTPLLPVIELEQVSLSWHQQKFSDNRFQRLQPELIHRLEMFGLFHLHLTVRVQRRLVH